MSDPNCAMRINLYNKKLYDFLERYARKGLFQKDKLRFPPCPGEPEYLVENLSAIGKKEWNEKDGIFIIDRIGDQVGHAPEGIFDVIPCFLLYLAWTYDWEEDTFLELKESLLREQTEIVTGFDQVIWEEAWLYGRVYWDGVYHWTAKFHYDRSSDTCEYTRTIHKFGLKAPELLADHDCSEREIYEKAMEEQSKYYDYDWDALCKKRFHFEPHFPDFSREDLPDDTKTDAEGGLIYYDELFDEDIE